MRARIRLALITAFCVLAAVAGIVIGLRERGDTVSGTIAAPAQPNTKGDLHFLNESMLIDENAVPPLEGTSWGRMVAVPQGGEAQVSPAGCALFLSQGVASQKGLAMRSSKGAAIGVELAITDRPPDLATLLSDCKVFTFNGGSIRSVVRLEPLNVDSLPVGVIGTLMHCETVASGQAIAWDIALITGYHRGVLVSAEYTPGPRGGAFNTQLVSSLDGIYRAQIERLDNR